ncbi:PAN domain-containing protein, partial [Toxoplasma gondii GT1]
THFNYHTDSHNCELKIKNGSDVVEAANVITGPKTCSSSCFTLGVGHTANNMATPGKMYSPFDCQSWCRDTNGCFYFTFNRNSSTCFLKGADAPGTEREYPGDMVGPKEFCSGGGEDVETEEESESGTGSDGAGSGAGSEGEEELKCFHPINWKSIARTLKTESGVKDAAACQRLCAKEDQCTHFNYHTDSHNCELKIKNGSDVVEAANVITGPKTCNSSCFTLGVGHTANNMARSEKKYSPFDCQSWCRDTNGCFYFTFNRNSSTCFLKGADAPGTEREYPGDMVGPKEFCSGGGEDVETEEESESGTGSDGAESGAGSEVESQPEALPGGQERPEEQPPIPGPSPDGDNGKEELVPPVPELEEGSGTAGTEADTPGHILPSRYPAPIPDTGLSSNLVCIHPRHKTTTAEIHKSLPGLPTPEDCHLACWHEGECTHFTYNLTTGRCDLRTNDSSHVTEEVDHITGPKSCNSSCFTVGKGHSAHNVAPITDKYSAFDCQSWCRQNNNCMYFTYNTVTKKCYLKGNDAPNTLSPSPDDVVGPRDFCPS